LQDVNYNNGKAKDLYICGSIIPILIVSRYEQLAFKELDFGGWKPAEKATLKRVVDAHYYTLTMGGNELIEVDADTNLCYWEDE